MGCGGGRKRLQTAECGCLWVPLAAAVSWRVRGGEYRGRLGWRPCTRLADNDAAPERERSMSEFSRWEGQEAGDGPGSLHLSRPHSLSLRTRVPSYREKVSVSCTATRDNHTFTAHHVSASPCAPTCISYSPARFFPFPCATYSKYPQTRPSGPWHSEAAGRTPACSRLLASLCCAPPR